MSFFRIPGDGLVPVFEIFRTAFDQSGEPMRVTVSIFPADRNQFIVERGRSARTTTWHHRLELTLPLLSKFSPISHPPGMSKIRR